jgi:hypothetical protein
MYGSEGFELSGIIGVLHSAQLFGDGQQWQTGFLPDSITCGNLRNPTRRSRT